MERLLDRRHDVFDPRDEEVVLRDGQRDAADVGLYTLSLHDALPISIKNLVHSSGSIEEANYEIPLWFKKEELHSYRRVEEEVMR